MSNFAPTSESQAAATPSNIPDNPIVMNFPIPDYLQGRIVGESEEAATADNMDPCSPFLLLKKDDRKKVFEWMRLRSAWIAKSLKNDIIIPDPTPQIQQDEFFEISARLKIVLTKDSVRCFLRLFTACGTAMSYGYTITSETLTSMVRENALRCAKVVLEGKAPELCSMHANPNCMNPNGCFPLHEAAERFSLDMIKLLFHYGASANVRTISVPGTQGLLPLHVAVENSCLHKYLEDNLSPVQYHEDYIYKLIHLLCLPEMKVFLDTVRLLAEKTDNLVDELWNYMKNGKLVQTAVLLLAAQNHFRKINPDAVPIIMGHLFNEHASLKRENGDTEEAKRQLEEREALLICKCKLFTIISQAGENLDSYIQTHSEVTYVDVFTRVSSILKEFGFCPKEEYIGTINMCPYNKISYSEIFYKGHMDATKAVARTSLPSAEEKAVRKRALKGWDPTYIRRGFYPYWRSVLGAQLYKARAGEKPVFDGAEFRNSCSKPMSNESSTPNHNIGFLARLQQLSGTHLSRRYSTAGFKMLTKVLKNA